MKSGSILKPRYIRFRVISDRVLSGLQCIVIRRKTNRNVLFFSVRERHVGMPATQTKSTLNGLVSAGVQGRRQGGGFGVKPLPLNLLCYKNVITYAKEFVDVFAHFLLV